MPDEVVPVVPCPRCGRDAIPMYAQPQDMTGFDDRNRPVAAIQYNAYCHGPACKGGWFACRTDDAMSRDEFDAMQALLADLTNGSVFGQLRNAGRQISTRRVTPLPWE